MQFFWSPRMSKKSTENILRLVPAGPRVLEINHSAVEQMEQVTERLRNGELHAVAYATVSPDGIIGAGWTHHNNTSRLWHAALFLENELRKRQ